MAVINLEKQFRETVEKGCQDFRGLNWTNKRAYAEWLVQTYFFVRHTSIFLALSAARYGYKLPKKQKSSLSHLREEQDHESLLLSDLENLGFDISHFHEMPATSALYQSQYYLIEHETPTAHLGYALYLEGIGCYACKDVFATLKKEYGEKCCRFIGVHGNEDPEHFDRGLKSILDVGSDEAKVILQNMQQTHLLYTFILSEIKQKSGVDIKMLGA